MSSGRAAPVVARAAARVATRRYHHKNHARFGAPRNAPSLFYPLLYPPHVRCRLQPTPARSPERRAADEPAPSAPSPSSAAHDLYDPEALLAHPCGFLVTVFPSAGGDGRSHTKKAVAEARYLLSSARDAPSTLGGAVEDLFVSSKKEGAEKDTLALPLHPRGALGCAFVPLALSPSAAATPFPAPHPLVVLGVSALLTFASDPPPPRGTPEFLSRLLPVMRTCRATEEDIVTTVSALLEQSGLGGGSNSPKSVSKSALDPFFSPTTFAVKYEHHGPSLLDRKSVMTRIEEIVLRSPDYEKDEDDPQKAVCVHVYHDVALVSVVPDWKRLRGFSPFELASANARARGDAEQTQTTGGEGYP